jgi:hypothetical protein
MRTGGKDGEMASEREAARWLGGLEDVPVFGEKVSLARKPRDAIKVNRVDADKRDCYFAGLVRDAAGDKLAPAIPPSARPSVREARHHKICNHSCERVVSFHGGKVCKWRPDWGRHWRAAWSAQRHVVRAKLAQRAFRHRPGDAVVREEMRIFRMRLAKLPGRY